MTTAAAAPAASRRDVCSEAPISSRSWRRWKRSIPNRISRRVGTDGQVQPDHRTEGPNELQGSLVTGALDPLVRVLEKLWRLNRWFGLLATLLLAFILSTMINDTPVLVLLIPVLVQLAARGGMASSKTLIPVNAAVLIGGMATTIGTSTNLLVVSIASDLGLPPMRVFHFTPIVLIAGLIAWKVVENLLLEEWSTLEDFLPAFLWLVGRWDAGERVDV